MEDFNETTVLFEDDGWLLLKSGETEMVMSVWYAEDPYKSGIYHKCVKHPQIKKVSSCWQDGKNGLWRCTNCDILVPMEVVGVWTLHNFDALSDG